MGAQLSAELGEEALRAGEKSDARVLQHVDKRLSDHASLTSAYLEGLGY